jgi:hypothetical protein
MRTDTAGICFVAVVVGLVESAGRENAAKTLTATTPIKVRLAATRSATLLGGFHHHYVRV